MSLNIKVSSSGLNIRHSVLVIPINSSLSLEAFGEKDVSAIRKIFKGKDFAANWNEHLICLNPNEGGAAVLGFIGLGEDEDIYRQREAIRRGLGRVISDVASHNILDIEVDLRFVRLPVELVEAVVEAARYFSYTFSDKYRKVNKRVKGQKARRVNIILNKRELFDGKRVASVGEQVMDGVDLTRTLVNRPANMVSPSVLANEARLIAKGSGSMRVKIFNKQQAFKRGFTAFLEVAKGSELEPKVIHLLYRVKSKKKPVKKIVLVGKGITFDSGGLSLKPAQYMENMKIDMAGAAAVLGVFKVLRELSLPIEVHGIIAACENMPSGKAYRPGDVITAKDGTTIEVANTDAEGRITLADALSYAVELKPDVVIDLATLTGASMVGLGESVAALFGNNEALVEELEESARVSYERLAHMPMPEEYRQLLESPVADLRNLGTSSYGGAITAALFLREFVKDVPWAHLDIAGPAYVERSLVSYLQKGGSGYGVRLLVNLLQRYSDVGMDEEKVRVRKTKRSSK